MSITAKSLYEQALAENERAKLAGWLHARLEDEGVDAAWRDEIARRIAEIDSGAVQAVSWEEAREQLFRQHTTPHAAKRP